MEGAIEFDGEHGDIPTQEEPAADRLRAVAQLPKPDIPAGCAAQVANVIELQHEFVALHAGTHCPNPGCRFFDVADGGTRLFSRHIKSEIS